MKAWILELKRQLIFPADVGLANLRQGLVDKPAVVLRSKLAAQQLRGDLRRQVSRLIPDLLEGLVAGHADFSLQTLALALDFGTSLSDHVLSRLLSIVPGFVQYLPDLVLCPAHLLFQFRSRSLRFVA